MARATTVRKYYKATEDRRGFRRTSNLEVGDRVFNARTKEQIPGIIIKIKGRYGTVEHFDHSVTESRLEDLAYVPSVRVIRRRAEEVRKMTPSQRKAVGLKVNLPEQWTYADKEYQEVGLAAPGPLQERLAKRAKRRKERLERLLLPVPEADGSVL